MAKKNRKKKMILLLSYIISLTGILFSSYHLITLNQHTKSNNDLKEKLNQHILNEENNQLPDSPPASNLTKYNIDWDYYKGQNPDSVAYLKVNNTNIQYIVVQGKDNAYYLKHNFNKEYNVTGWVFMDYRNKINGKDKNTIIYGHNVYNDSMFGSLKKVLKKEWYTNSENLKIDLVTKGGLKTYQIFSIYTIKKEDYYLQIEFESTNQYRDFINTIKNRSIHNFGIDVGESDQILTLSTCTNGSKSRIVVHAKLLKD